MGDYKQTLLRILNLEYISHTKRMKLKAYQQGKFTRNLNL